MRRFETFEDFMQEAINKADCGFREKYAKSIFTIIGASPEESRMKIARIVKNHTNGSQNYEERYYAWKELNKDMTPLVAECASSILLSTVLSSL
jgi:hypothetical protein